MTTTKNNEATCPPEMTRTAQDAPPHTAMPLIIGVGQDYRCDDTVGLLVARRLQQQLPASWTILESNGDGAALMAAWEGHQEVIVVDAVAGNRPAGSLYQFDAAAQALPAELFQTSTHHWGLAEAIEMSRILGTMPKKLFVFGIAGAHFHHGETLTPAVAEALEAVCTLLQDRLLSTNHTKGENHA